MATSSNPVEPALVSCDVCRKEVPIAEAMTPEATDYFVHFCGLECYEKWKNQGGKAREQVDKSGS